MLPRLFRRATKCSVISQCRFSVRSDHIVDGDVVEFEYQSMLRDGTIIHSDVSKVRVGSKMVTDEMNAVLIGKFPGNEGMINSNPQDRGSKYEDDLVVELALPTGFTQDRGLKEGDFVEIPASLMEGGNDDEKFLAKILKIEAESDGEILTLDLNDPYATDVIVVKFKILTNHGNLPDFDQQKYEEEKKAKRKH